VKSPRRRLAPLFVVVILFCAALAAFAWRSLEGERAREERDRAGRARAVLAAAAEALEADLARLREAPPPGTLRVPRETPPPPDPPPPLGEIVARERPDLAGLIARAAHLEFAEGNPALAAEAYAELEAQCEHAPTLARLRHARGRALLAAGNADAAREAYERLLATPAEVRSESGLPLAVVAALHLAELGAAAPPPPLDALDLYERGLVLARLGRSADLAAVRALQSADPAAGDAFVRRDGYAFLVAALPDGTRAALPLGDFPSSAARRRLDDLGAAAGLVVSLDPPDAPVAQAPVAAAPPLTLWAAAADPAALEAAHRRRALLLGAMLVGLLAALAAAMGLTVRAVSRELELARLKSDFASSVSHELKTPLTSIRMFAEMLESGKVADESKRAEYYRLMHRESVRLSNLVQNVLDFARIEEGRKTYRRRPEPLGPVATEAVEIFRAVAQEAGFRFRLDLPAEPAVADVDREAILQALLNLLDNAVKYSGEPGEIVVALAAADGKARLSVQDRGPGVAPEDLPRIFEKFTRGGDAMTRAVPGAGLGLALVRHVAEAHGGTAGVESRPGEGSRFTVELPLWRGSSS
jgi:signal transduction histidine kinase